MNSNIILNLILSLFEVNKSSKNVILFDCNHYHSYKNLRTVLNMSSENIRINLVSIKSEIYLSTIENLLFKVQNSSQIGIIMNFNCENAKNIIVNVNFFISR